MESILTQASVAVELFSFGYFAGSFFMYAHRRSQHPVHWQSAKRIDPESPMLQESSKPPVRQRSTVEQLRQECQKAGIKWRNAHGKNKHLKKDEMLAALQKLERAKQKKPAPPPSSKRVANPASGREHAA